MYTEVAKYDNLKSCLRKTSAHASKHASGYASNPNGRRSFRVDQRCPLPSDDLPRSLSHPNCIYSETEHGFSPAPSPSSINTSSGS